MKRRNKNALQKTIFTIHNNNGEFKIILANRAKAFFRFFNVFDRVREIKINMFK